MPTFHYDVVDERGRASAGTLDAPDEEQAARRLKSKGFSPMRLEPAPRFNEDAARVSPAAGAEPAPTSGWSTPIRWAIPLLAPVKARERAAFTRQLATLLRAGMPLLRGLETLARQERNPALKGIISALADDIRSGSALSGGMARHPRLFDRLFLNMVRAGEAGGVLEEVLERLARFQEKMLQLRGKVKAALVYPVVVLIVAVSILTGLLVFVVPKFQQIFTDLLKGAPLPPLTRALLAVSAACHSRGPLVLAGVAALGLVLRFVRRTSAGVRLTDGILVRLPVFGDLLLKSLAAQFSRTLGTLLASGVPILRALAISRDTCANQRVAGAIDIVHDRVKAGEPVASPLEGTGVFPAMVTSMIDVGEHTGRLPEMLGRVADIYEDEVDLAVAGLSSLLEPILIVLLAGVVGTIVIALLLPIIRVVQLLS